jgi:hypothetical protein
MFTDPLPTLEVPMFIKSNPDKLSTFKGGNRTPLQLIVADTMEEAMSCAAVLGEPMANYLETLFNANGIPLLPPHGQNRLGYEKRLNAITELLKEGQSGVYVAVADRGSNESAGDLCRRYNWPEKILFLADEVWWCRDGICTPQRSADGSRMAFTYASNPTSVA